MPQSLSPEKWSRLETLFVAAADLPPDIRSRFVENECGGDTEMRDELLSLLRYDTLSQPEVDEALGAGAAWVVHGEALEGRVLGAYRIEREIGRGGMSVVYLAARDDGEFRKQVAIKLIKRGMDTDAVVGRLRRERRILAALEHPFIARLLDGGTTPDGRPYIVMDHVDGLPIDRYCARHALDPLAVCALMEKVCETVSYAHRNLVVHRGLKPANILTTSDGTPRLLDFGIARVLEGDTPADGSPETRGFSPAFTPEYASPEQLSGAAAGTGVDVYALGVILYELLAGTRPYGSETAACGREAERASITAARNGLPNRRVKQLRGDLDNILAKAIHRDPGRRYLSAEQLQLDLFRHRSQLPVAARGDSIAYRMGKLFARRRFGAIAAGIAVLAMVAGVASTLSQSRAAQAARLRAEDSARQSAAARERAENEHSEAESQRARAEMQRTAADRRFDQVREVARKFTTDLDDVISPLPGSAPARKMLVETGLRYYDSLVAEAAGNRDLLEEIARGYDKLGDAQGNPYNANLGDRPAALASYEKARDLRAHISDDSPAFLADQLLNVVRRAQMLTQKGDMPGAAKIARSALRTAEGSAVAREYTVQQALAKTWIELGDVYNQSGSFEQAAPPYEQALRIWTELARTGRNPIVERTGIALAHTKLGEIYARRNRGVQTLEHIRIALPIGEDLAAREPNSIPRLRKVYVDYFLMSWAYDSADAAAVSTPEEVRSALAKTVEIAERMQAADAGNTNIYRDVANGHLNYGNWFRGREDFSNALVEFRKYADAMNRFIDGKPRTMEINQVRSMIDEYLGQGLVDAGNATEGLEHLSAAAAISAELEKQNPGLSHHVRQRAYLMELEGLAHVKLKDWPAAIATFTAARSVLESMLKSDPKDENVHDGLQTVAAGIADAYAGAGRMLEARASIQIVLDMLNEKQSRRELSPAEAKLKADSLGKMAEWK